MAEMKDDAIDKLRFAILQGTWEIKAARRELRRRKWVRFGFKLSRSRLGIRVAAAARQLGLSVSDPTLRGHPLKSWDVLRSLNAITATMSHDARILDVGSVGCPMLPALRRLGYGDLHGVD